MNQPCSTHGHPHSLISIYRYMSTAFNLQDFILSCSFQKETFVCEQKETLG